MAKLGRKIKCEYNKDVKCILLVNGNKLCVFDETSEEQIEQGEAQFGFCPLLPKSEREGLESFLKQEGFTDFRTFKD